MEYHVFISYSRQDSDLMGRIRDDLRAADLQVWTDDSLIPGTDSWKNAIENAIQNAGSVVVLLSPDSKQSVWVEREMDYARACKVPIIPVLARGDNEISAIPFELINAQRVDLRGDYEAGIRTLIAGLQSRFRLRDGKPDLAAHPHAVPLVADDDDALDPWNILHQMRMMRWLFLEPDKVIAYREKYGVAGLRKTGAWLVSDIVWLALLAPLAGFLIGTIQMPGVESDPSTILLLVLSALLAVGGWFITAWIGWHTSHLAALTLLISMTALALLSFFITAGIAGVALTGVGGIIGLFNMLVIGLSIGAAAGIAFHFANPTTGTLAALIISGTIVNALMSLQIKGELGIAGAAMAAMALGIGVTLDRHLKHGKRTAAGIALFVIMVIVLVLMAWVYFLGGWPVLMSLQ